VNDIYVSGITSVAEIQELVNTKTSATGVVTHDWATGAVFYHSSISANFTCNLTNMPTTANRSYVVVLILAQGASPFYANALQINSSAQTILWANATIPTPVANRTEIQSFTLYYSGAAWTATAQYTSFG
jgi:hypothetical protein